MYVMIFFNQQHYFKGIFPRIYNTTTTTFKLVFHNAFSSDILMYRVDVNGVKKNYRADIKPGISQTFVYSTYYQPWVFKRTDNGLRLYAYVENKRVSIFEAKEFSFFNVSANSTSELHVVVNDQGFN